MPTLISQTNTRGQLASLTLTVESIPLLENGLASLYVMNISVVLDNSGLRVITRSVVSLVGCEGRQEPCGGMTRTHNTERL